MRVLLTVLVTVLVSSLTGICPGRCSPERRRSKTDTRHFRIKGGVGGIQLRRRRQQLWTKEVRARPVKRRTLLDAPVLATVLFSLLKVFCPGCRSPGRRNSSTETRAFPHRRWGWKTRAQAPQMATSGRTRGTCRTQAARAEYPRA